MDNTKYEYPNFIKLKSKCGMSEDVHYSVMHKDLPHEFKVYAQTHLNETEERKATGIRKLRDFMKKQNLPDTDDDTLIFVLRNCKYNFKKSEAKLKKFLDTRNRIFRKVAAVDMKMVEKYLDDRFFGCLPYRDKHGRSVVFTRAPLNPDVLNNMEDLLTVVLASIIILMQASPITAVAGVAYIASTKDLSISVHYRLPKFYAPFARTVLELPIRMARVDIIYENVLQRMLYNIVRPFLSSKIIRRVHFHGSELETLQQFYHPDILPAEFGGNMGPPSTLHYKEEVLNFIRQLKDEYKV